MSNTTNLILPLLAAAQAQKHVTVNESLLKLDALLMCAPKSDSTSAEPGSPADGDVYILPPGKTGTHWGPAGNYAIAHYHDGVWQFYTPREGFFVWIRDTDVIKVFNGTTWQLFSGIATDVAGICDGRLTLSSGVPVMTGSVTAATTVYFTPYNGNKIGLYDGSSAWALVTFAEVSISLSGKAADTNYDVFGYANSGTLTLELVAWTNDATRATALVLQDGVYVKSGATTRRYLGTIRTTATTGQCEWTPAPAAAAGGTANKLYVWNMYNRRKVVAKNRDSTGNWTYTTAAWRAKNNSAGNGIAFVMGLAEDGIFGATSTNSTNTSSAYRQISLGLDSTSTPDFTGYVAPGANNAIPLTVNNQFAPQLGKHVIYPLEYSEAAGTCTWFGTTYADFILELWM